MGVAGVGSVGGVVSALGAISTPSNQILVLNAILQEKESELLGEMLVIGLE